MERERRTIEEVFDHYGHIERLAPPRSRDWLLDKGLEEVEEIRGTDPVTHPEAYRGELGNLLMVWIGLCREAGISVETALQATFMEENVVIDRLIRTNDLDGNGKTHEQNYRMIKWQDQQEQQST